MALLDDTTELLIVEFSELSAACSSVKINQLLDFDLDLVHIILITTSILVKVRGWHDRLRYLASECVELDDPVAVGGKDEGSVALDLMLERLKVYM